MNNEDDFTRTTIFNQTPVRPAPTVGDYPPMPNQNTYPEQDTKDYVYPESVQEPKCWYQMWQTWLLFVAGVVLAGVLGWAIAANHDKTEVDDVEGADAVASTQMQETIDAQEQKISELEEQVASVTGADAAANQQLKDSEQKAADATAKAVELQNQVNDLNAQVATLESDKTAVSQELESMKSALETAKNELEANLTDTNKLKETVENLTGKLSENGISLPWGNN